MSMFHIAGALLNI